MRRVSGIDNRRLGRLAEFDHVALQTAEIEMSRAWRVGQCCAPGMPQQPRQFGGRIDRRREFGDRSEERCMGDFLITVAVLERRLLAPGQRHYRAAAEPRVLQARGEIGCTHRLRHAHGGLAGDAGVTVGHIGRGFLRMGEDAGDAEDRRIRARCGATPIRQKRHASCRFRPKLVPAIGRRSSLLFRSSLVSSRWCRAALTMSGRRRR